MRFAVRKARRFVNFAYDAVNRLVQVNFLNPQPTTKPDTVQMTYDGLGRRVAITELHGTTVINAYTYVWCGVNSCQERDVTGHTIGKQFFDQGEQINGTNYYFACDHLGSVREMTDSNGVVHANYDYDAYGRQTKLSGDLDSDFGYTGFYVEKTLCLDLTWFRAYDPEKGRWLSKDPAGEAVGYNLYQYVSNNAFDYIDKLGLFQCSCSGGSGGGCQSTPPYNPPGIGGGGTSDNSPVIRAKQFHVDEYHACLISESASQDNAECLLVAYTLGIGAASFGPWVGVGVAALGAIVCANRVACKCKEEATY
jgi:RHS repeat-associated protein